MAPTTKGTLAGLREPHWERNGHLRYVECFSCSPPSKVETPIHDSIRELVTWEWQRAWSEIMNVLVNPKGKCWALESEFLEA